MATVYLAEDLKHRRPVAVKILHPHLSVQVGADRFQREVEIAAQLSHPHILALIDSGESEGLLYYVMPYVQGESLRARLDRERRLPVDEAVATVRQILGALSFAHSKGVVHRDIKPENVMLHEGEAVVADFGIGADLSGRGDADADRDGAGDAGVHEPGAGLGGAGAGRTERHLLDRVPALRDAGGRAAVHRAQRPGDHVQAVL
jgi:serine/threonine-protein kinase